LSAAKTNGWALEKRARAEQVALAQREERERIEALEQSTITAGINAWGRLKCDTARLSDERLIGEALLAGRRRCMREVGADKPRGIKYVKANAGWLKETGFHEIQKTRRQTCMLIAENWVEFQAWKKTLPIWRQAELNNSVSAWRAFRTRNRTDRPGWRARQKTGVTNAAAAIEAVKREAPELPHDIAHNVAFAVMRAVGLAVPRELFVRTVSPAAVEVRPA
jgi:hypothetical protein